MLSDVCCGRSGIIIPNIFGVTDIGVIPGIRWISGRVSVLTDPDLWFADLNRSDIGIRNGCGLWNNAQALIAIVYTMFLS